MSDTNRLVQHYLKAPYARILIPEDDGTYSAEILEFPGCFAEGDTPDEAIRNLESSAAAWIEAALEQGQEIPEPQATHGYSGRLNLRLPRSIHKKAAHFAQRDDVSLNQFLACAAAARVGAEEFYERLLERIEAHVRQQPVILNVSAVSVLQDCRFSHAETGPVYVGYYEQRKSDEVLPLMRWSGSNAAKLTASTKD